MPLTYSKNIADNCFLSIWDIREDLAVLIEKAEYELERKWLERILDELTFFTSVMKKKERLATCLAFADACKKAGLPEKISAISHEENGRPYISGESFHISISHSFGLAGVVLDMNYPVGLDIEKVKPRVEKIKHKFLSQKEQQQLDENNKVKHLTLHWSAKETLYKIHAQGQLNFIQHLAVKPFEVAESGNITALICKHKPVLINLHFFCLDDYVVVWGRKTENISEKK